MLIIPIGLSIISIPYNLLRILYVIHSYVVTSICMIISYNKPGHLLKNVIFTYRSHLRCFVIQAFLLLCELCYLFIYSTIPLFHKEFLFL